MKVDDQNPDDFKSIDSKYYWSLVDLKNAMSKKIADIRQSFRQDALKFLNGRNEAVSYTHLTLPTILLV